MSQVRLPAAAVEALTHGRVIEAVKIVRAAGGLSLKDAHDMVQAFQAQTSRGKAGMQMPTQGAGAQSPGGFVFPPEAAAALARGEVLQAIAAVRGANANLDLKAAKEAIDQMRAQARPLNAASAASAVSRPRVPTVVAGDRNGIAGVLVLLAIAFVAIAWWWLREA